MSFKAVCPAAGKRSPRERSPRVPRTFKHTGGELTPLDHFCRHHLSLFSFFGGPNFFAGGKVHFMEHLMTLPQKLQELCFVSGPKQGPEVPCPFHLSPRRRGREGGKDGGLLAPVCACISLSTLQQKWEEASGLPGILWGRNRGHWRGNNLGPKRQSNVIFVGVMKGRTATQLGDS